LNLIEDEVNRSINDDMGSEWSVVNEAPSQPAPSESGSEWSVLNEEPVSPAISESGSEWSLVGSIHISTAIDTPNIHPSNLRCPLCPPNRKPFRNPAAIQAHMSSAAHCPLAFVLNNPSTNSALTKKKKHFATLGGLAQHLEDGACQGGVETFINVMKYVEEQLESLGFGNLKLLLD
jgi:hypothetical protein